MAMILDAFVGRYIGKLSEVIDGEISMILGVKDELKKLRERMESIGVYLESAEQRRHTDKTIGIWVKKLKDIMYDADDIIDRCMIEGWRLLEDHPSESVVRRPLSLFSCFSCIKFQHKIGYEIRELNDEWKHMVEDTSILSKLEPTRQGDQVSGVNHRQTFSMEIKSEIVGEQIEEATKSLVESLTKEENRKCRVFGIVGMGGIGKTTLASHIFNDERMKQNFSIRVWTCVSQEFSETSLLKEIIRGAGGNYREAETKQELINHLCSTLSQRFFIVLDDVWEKDVWEDLLRYAVENTTASGRILITTRNTNVAGNIGAEIHHVNKMDTDSGWKLLCKIVFGDDEEEEEISSLKGVGVQIVEKCDGLPLAIKVIAGVLRSKERSNLEWNKVLKSEVWSISQLQEQLPRALFLSYEYLPSDRKQCFLYCSLFPEDYLMDHDELIRYWVAEGFVKTTGGDNLMEDVAKDYYRELIARNLLQPCDEFGDLSNLAGNYCKMHDLLRSLALFLTPDESIFIDNEQPHNINPSSKIRRLTIVNIGKEVEVPDIIKQQKCLRTLIIRGSSPAMMVDNKLFEKLAFLRVMDLSCTELENLPDSVGDLLHLRYLNLGRSNIRELPESIGCLVNLQILNLSFCEFLNTLPKAITKLCNLRCLFLEGTPLTHVPKGIGKLKHLTHLQGFVIGHDDRRDDEGCDLKELQSLSQLRFLEIDRLERTQPAGAPALGNSSFLRTLILNCGQPEVEVEAIAIQRIDKIYNELSPQSTHLQKLEIHNFIGTGFFSWMMSSSLAASFPNLTSITLDNCISFLQLPPLGLLPQLKYLYINNASAIKTIGLEFFGLHASSAATSFPKLEELEFYWMENWEEWSFGMVEGVGEERRGAPKLLPHLMKLELNICPKLRALPPLGQLPQLKSLAIRYAGAIETIGPEFLGPRASSAATSFPKLEELIFEDMENWEEWSFGMVEGVGEERRGAPKLLPHLMKLQLYRCRKLRALPPLGLLPELKFLWIEKADAIKTIGPEFLDPRASSAATSFPNLEELCLKEMSNWEEWSFGMVEGVGEERRGAPKLLPHLMKLKLERCPELKALPEGLRHATNLQELSIVRADNLKEINNLNPSLKSLEIWNCRRLEHVENLDKLQVLIVGLPPSTLTSTTDADGQIEPLPRWLVELLGQHSLEEFKLRCSLSLLKTFLKDGPNWLIIQPIPQVEIDEPLHPDCGSSHIWYTKDPPTFEANVVESEESVD